MDWIQHILTALLIGLFFMYANKKAVKKVDKNKEGKYELKMNEAYKWIGFLSVLIAVGTIILSIVFYEEGIFIWVGLIVLIFGGLGTPLLMYYYNHRLIFDEESIEVKNWKGTIDNIKWEEIDRIKFTPISGYLTLKTRSKQLKINQHLVGIIEFVKMMELKTDYTAKGLKLPFGV